MFVHWPVFSLSDLACVLFKTVVDRACAGIPRLGVALTVVPPIQVTSNRLAGEGGISPANYEFLNTFHANKPGEQAQVAPLAQAGASHLPVSRAFNERAENNRGTKVAGSTMDHSKLCVPC